MKMIRKEEGLQRQEESGEGWKVKMKREDSRGSGEAES